MAPTYGRTVSYALEADITRAYFETVESVAINLLGILGYELKAVAKQKIANQVPDIQYFVRRGNTSNAIMACECESLQAGVRYFPELVDFARLVVKLHFGVPDLRERAIIKKVILQLSPLGVSVLSYPACR